MVKLAGTARIAGELGLALSLALPLALSLAPLAVAAAPHRVAAPPAGPVQAIRIVAVVNGQPITNDDVDNRTRLFALATGLPVAPEMLDRLKPQIVRQLIDERLRMQEVGRQHVVIPDKEIAAAIGEIEQRNGMKPGGLRRQLESDGISFTTLIDQVRTQLGWTQVLRQKLGDRAHISDAEATERQRLDALQTGKPEYRVGEIFIPIERGGAADAQRFAETVIKELRAGAPFAVVATQFSQNQTALQGGDLGWVQPNQLDPQVAQVVAEMPPGAISNPVPVPGGLDIATVLAKRQIGQDMGTVLSMRQVFLPFTSALNPQAPTQDQLQTLQRAKSLAVNIKSCAQMEAVAQQVKSPRPADPGEVRLENLSPPAFRDMLTKLPLETVSQPIVAPDGVALMMVCSRGQKNLAQLDLKTMKEQILAQRVDLLSRQLQQDLRSQARIELRPGGRTA